MFITKFEDYISPDKKETINRLIKKYGEPIAVIQETPNEVILADGSDQLVCSPEDALLFGGGNYRLKKIGQYGTDYNNFAVWPPL